MAGIVKSTKRRFLIGKRIKEVEVPGTVLDTELFFADMEAMGGLKQNSLLNDELNNLPNIVKNESVLSLVLFSLNTGEVRAFNGDTKSVELFSFERNSSGTRYGNNGVITIDAEARIRPDRDVASNSFNGYMFEKASTNICIYSEPTSISHISNPVNVTIEETGFGLGMLSSGVGLSASVPSNFRLQATIDLNKTYTFSVYVKRSDSGIPVVGVGNLELRIGNNIYPSRHSISPIKNGVYKITATYDDLKNASGSNFFIINRDGVFSYKLSGFQLEEGSIATSYLPTSGSEATRLADRMTSNRPIAVYAKNSFYLESDRYKGWFGDGVDHLNIVGRNLLPNSGFYNGTTGIGDWSLSSYTTSSLSGNILTHTLTTVSNAARIERSLNLKAGIYTLVIFAKIKDYFRYNSWIGASIIDSFSEPTPNNFDVHWVTFRVLSDGNITMRLYFANEASWSIGDKFEIDYFTLVKGSQPMLSWSPAPEDLVRIDGNGNITVESNGSDHLRSLSLVPRALTQEEI